MNVIELVSTTVVIFNLLLLLLIGYHYARGGNLHDVGKFHVQSLCRKVVQIDTGVIRNFAK
jgi:hypothetical protein